MKKNTTKRVLSICLVCSLLPVVCFCLEAFKPTEIIDIPTADIVEYQTFNLDFRLYGTGGMLSRMIFGVFKPINIGISWDVNNLIGYGYQKIDTRPPAILFKARIYSGGMTLPAIALGYEGQGYGFYNDKTDKYSDREKGVFLALTREYFIPGLEITAGCNIYDFDGEGLYGFGGITYGLEDKFLVLAEYDNLRHMPENRANMGLRMAITGNVGVELVGRNLFKGTESERIVIVKYKGNF